MRFFIIAGLFALLGISVVGADDTKGSKLFFHVLTVEAKDLPPDLAAKYSHNDEMIVVTFKPLDHPAKSDGSNLGDGEGSWMDRGMRHDEPGKIIFIQTENSIMSHTLKVSDGPFLFRVINSHKGYFQTVPFVDPTLENG
jgi:hypothetical protein